MAYVRGLLRRAAGEPMMRRMVRGLAIAGIVAASFLDGAWAFAESPDPSFGSRAHDNYVDVSASRRASGDGNGGAQVSAGPRILRRYAPACNGNAPAGLPSLDTLCPAAFNVCPGDGVLYWVFVASAG